MKENYKRFIQYGLALTAGLGLGSTAIASPSEAVLAFNRLTLNGINANGLSFNGIGQKGTIPNRLDQIKPNTTTVTLADKPVQEISVEKGQLVFRLPSAQQ